MGVRSRAGGAEGPWPDPGNAEGLAAEEVRAVSSVEHEVLARAAGDALGAPSVHHTQPRRTATS